MASDMPRVWAGLRHVIDSSVELDWLQRLSHTLRIISGVLQGCTTASGMSLFRQNASVSAVSHSVSFLPSCVHPAN